MSATSAGTSNAPFGSIEEYSSGTGQIILRLAERETHDSPDLREVAAEHGFAALSEFLSTNAHLTPQRVIRHVEPRILREREQIAALTPFTPIESLTAYWRIDVSAEDDVESHRSQLHDMPEVSVAYHEMAVRNASVKPTPPDLAGSEADLTGHNTFEVDQHFLKPAPEGIGAYGAWTRTNADGTGVNVVDLEEGWILTHEDLPHPQLLYGDNRQSTTHAAENHGAAALGIVAGVNNDIGIIGIAPRIASLNTVSHYDKATNSAFHVADAIDAATKHMNPGDILLLEVQRIDGRKLLPVETDSADLHAIRHAVAQGIIVVEAGGNNAEDLDQWADPTGQHCLNRSDPAFVDSGAIMVGSSAAAVSNGPDGVPGHARYYSSSHGSRIDVYAWGEKICTTGYGHLAGESGAVNSYTNDFGQTSGASAIIAGAAAIVQSWHRGICSEPLTPQEMRRILANPATGTPQSDRKEGAVGIMPNLDRIMANGIAFRHKVKNVLKRVRLASGTAHDPFAQYRTGGASAHH